MKIVHLSGILDACLDLVQNCTEEGQGFLFAFPQRHVPHYDMSECRADTIRHLLRNFLAKVPTTFDEDLIIHMDDFIMKSWERSTINPKEITIYYGDNNTEWIPEENDE